MIIKVPKELEEEVEKIVKTHPNAQRVTQTKRILFNVGDDFNVNALPNNVKIIDAKWSWLPWEKIEGDDGK